MKKRKREKYTCAACKGVFYKGWSDEKAAEEFHERHPTMPIDEETALICDMCYKAILKDIEEHPEKYSGLEGT
jgi:hypothetical protein